MRIKREFPRFAPWDAVGMAAHLEAMEAKGWLFRGTDWLGRLEYEENLPQSVRYAVACVPSRRDWRVTPTEPERDLECLCFDAGWRKVAALPKFHVYRNPDPDATDLESDELTRLDTLDRALRRPMTVSALGFAIGGGVLLGVLLWFLMSDLPRALSVAALPGGLVFLLWMMLTMPLQLLLYRRWYAAAEQAAHAGLPCPEAKGWRAFTLWNRLFAILSVVWILTQGSPVLTLGYAAVMLVFQGLRWYLENRMADEDLAEKVFRTSLAVCFLLLFAFNRIAAAAAPSPAVDAIPLSAQDLMDTSGMDLHQYDLNGSDAPWASYHDYWQPDNNSSLSLRCVIFDLRLPILEDSCRDWFEEDFRAMARRMDTTVEPADAAPWSAEAVRRAENSWLVFYDSRIVELHTSWELTPDQIAAAAEKLAP